ncbi:MAG TPA: hypothetical protein VGS19_10980 [Streptosporangiaceae bacterium]|nr:hypothetical protein [Streptosporangiaceae bacterium]
MTGAIALGLAELTKGPEFDIPVMQGRTPALLIGASLLLTVAVCLTTRTGRRVLALLAIPGVPYAGYLLGSMYGGPAWWPTAMQAAWVLLPTLLAIFVTIALARARSAPHGGNPPQGSSPADRPVPTD